jgi:hypothetical protein
MGANGSLKELCTVVEKQIKQQIHRVVDIKEKEYSWESGT